MGKKTIFYTIFFVVLTAGFLVAVFAGTDRWKKKSPIISFVKPFVFTTQDNQPVYAKRHGRQGLRRLISFSLPVKGFALL
jgi:protein SCO1/2